MECDECDRLWSEYERLELAYSSAIDILDARSGLCTKAEFARLRAVADEARIASASARFALEQHKLIHSTPN
jgi:hypothetical protein